MCEHTYTNAHEHTSVQKAAILIIEHYPKINIKKHSYKKSEVTQLEARASSDTKAVLVYTCGGGGPACIHKQYTSDLSIHNQHIERGCPLLAKSSLKGDTAADGNSSYLKAPPELVKNKKSYLLTFFF